MSLSEENKVTSTWVAGHNAVKDNDIVDSYERKGAQTAFVGPEPFWGISSNTISVEIKKKLSSKRTNNWNNLLGIRQAEYN